MATEQTAPTGLLQKIAALASGGALATEATLQLVLAALGRPSVGPSIIDVWSDGGSPKVLTGSFVPGTAIATGGSQDWILELHPTNLGVSITEITIQIEGSLDNSLFGRILTKIVGSTLVRGVQTDYVVPITNTDMLLLPVNTGSVPNFRASAMASVGDPTGSLFQIRARKAGF